VTGTTGAQEPYLNGFAQYHATIDGLLHPLRARARAAWSWHSADPDARLAGVFVGSRPRRSRRPTPQNSGLGWPFAVIATPSRHHSDDGTRYGRVGDCQSSRNIASVTFWS
jgi:hypothetical protein